MAAEVAAANAALALINATLSSCAGSDFCYDSDFKESLGQLSNLTGLMPYELAPSLDTSTAVFATPTLRPEYVPPSPPADEGICYRGTCLPLAAVIGIGVGVGLLVIFLLICTVCCYKRCACCCRACKRSRMATAERSAPPAPAPRVCCGLCGGAASKRATSAASSRDDVEEEEEETPAAAAAVTAVAAAAPAVASRPSSRNNTRSNSLDDRPALSTLPEVDEGDLSLVEFEATSPHLLARKEERDNGIAAVRAREPAHIALIRAKAATDPLFPRQAGLLEYSSPPSLEGEMARVGLADGATRSRRARRADGVAVEVAPVVDTSAVAAAPAAPSVTSPSLLSRWISGAAGRWGRGGRAAGGGAPHPPRCE